MPTLTNYTQFDGLHWETGTIRNALDYQGIKAPHTEKPFSEALLMGISGGPVMGYFNFIYEGHDPHARLLTRNTFNPWDNLLSRMGVIQNVLHTAKADKAVQNLVDTLEDGTPAIVWADMFSLPYNDLSWGEDMWAMMPILVYGYDADSDMVHIADRSFKPLTVSVETVAKARARVKKDKHRIITLEAPDEGKLVAALQAGIWDSIKLYTEKPPKGSKKNFGLEAYKNWAKMLTNTKNRLSWEKQYPAGRMLFAALISQYTDINIFGKNSPAERDKFAQFFDEAATLLNNPTLNEVANCYRKSGEAWANLSNALLPEDQSMLGDVRTLLDKQHHLFMKEGGNSAEERTHLLHQINALKTESESNFPLSSNDVVALRENIQQHVLAVHDIEAEAVNLMKEALV